MRRKKWRGTILFTVILVVMGVTIGLRLYGIGQTVTASSATSVSSTGSATAAAPVPATTSGNDTTPPATSTPSTSTASARKVLTGSVEQTPYGPIQVQVTFDGSKITAVTELQAPSDDGRSVSINQQAAPVLRQEVLASQSANVDTVSGATYTSDGYKQSVQSAIDQL